MKYHFEERKETVQLTKFDYSCYKINSTVTHPPKQSGVWQIKGIIRGQNESRIPLQAHVYLTSEENSNGIFFYAWWDGKVFEQIVKMHTVVTVGIRPVEHFYLDHDGQCSHETNFNKYKARIHRIRNFTESYCEVSCSPVDFFLDSFPNCGWDEKDDSFEGKTHLSF